MLLVVVFSSMNLGVWYGEVSECRNGCSDYQKLILLSAFGVHSNTHSHLLARLVHTSFSRNTFATHTNNKSCKNFNFPSIFLAFQLLATYVWQINGTPIHKYTYINIVYIVHMYVGVCVVSSVAVKI